MDNQVEYVKSERGVNKIHFRGYRYVRHKDLKNGVVGYHCEMKRRGICKVSMKVLDDQCVGFLHEHTHAPDHFSSEVQKVRASMKERAETSEETAQHILTAAAMSTSEGASALMATVPDLRRNIRRQRRRVDGDDKPVVDYFEDTYIGRPQRRGRRLPLFPIGSWNQHQRTIDGLPRTNNHLEGWHRRLLSNMSGCHPSIWKFLDVLRREQALNDQVITQMLAGVNVANSRRKYRDVQQRLAAIATDWPNRNSVNFLRSVAHNIRL